MKITSYLILASLFYSISAFAVNSEECGNLKLEQAKLAFAGEKLVNISSANGAVHGKLPTSVNIDIKNKYLAFNASSAKLRLLASKGCCQSKTASLRYQTGFGNISEDVFNFDGANQVVSWSRIYTGGISKAVNFLPDGRAYPIQHTQSFEHPSTKNSVEALDL